MKIAEVLCVTLTPSQVIRKAPWYFEIDHDDLIPEASGSSAALIPSPEQGVPAGIS